MKVNDIKGLISELKRRTPFDRIEETHLNWVAERMEWVNIPEGTPILTPGTPCDTLYFIHSGLIQLEAMGDTDESQRVLAELVPGESFPLEALEEHRPVFSIFRAKVDTVCFTLKIVHFEQLKQFSRIFADFCHYRASGFLEQSRRVYRLHFSHQSDEQQRLNMPLSILMDPQPLTFNLKTPISEVLQKMHDQMANEVVITTEEKIATGIFTVRDLLGKVVLSGIDMNSPISGAMAGTPERLPADAPGYEAAMVIASGSSLVIIEDKGRMCGIVTERNLFDLQRISLSQINAQIHSADTVDWLHQCHRDIHTLAENMLVQGVNADQITQIISSLNDQVLCRTLNLELANEDLLDLQICWLAFGSEGRYEQTLSTDQDNGIIFEAPKGVSPDKVRERLIPIARRVNMALDQVGFPLCKGNIMACNPDCCLSITEWQSRFLSWITEPTPDALLNATIFFDFRHLYGSETLSDNLRSWLATACREQTLFFRLLAENALQRTPPLGFFRDFVVENHADCPTSIDLKLSGVTLFVDTARVYALASGVTRSNTKQRLLLAGDLRKWPQSEVNAWADAFSFLQSLRIRHQYELQRSAGRSHNRLNPYELNNLDRKFFLESLRQAGKLQKRLSMDFGMKLM